MCGGQRKSQIQDGTSTGSDGLLAQEMLPRQRRRRLDLSGSVCVVFGHIWNTFGNFEKIMKICDSAARIIRDISRFHMPSKASDRSV